MREAFLGTDNPTNIMDDQINIFDNSAINILRIIETQRNLIVKCQQYWDQNLTEGTRRTSETLPGILEVSPVLTTLKSKLNAAREFLNNFIIEKNDNDKSISLQYRAKLIEMLNKY